MYRLICQRNQPSFCLPKCLWWAPFFQMFIVLGMYNFDIIVSNTISWKLWPHCALLSSILTNKTEIRHPSHKDWFFFLNQWRIQRAFLFNEDWRTKLLLPIKKSEMVVCYQNCSDLLWEKNVLVIEKNFWNSRLQAENLQISWNH